MSVRGETLWAVVATGTTTLFEYDTRTGEIVAVVDAGRTNVDVAATPEAVWVSDDAGTLVRVDPRTHRVVAQIPVRKNLKWIAAADHAVWTTVAS